MEYTEKIFLVYSASMFTELNKTSILDTTIFNGSLLILDYRLTLFLFNQKINISVYICTQKRGQLQNKSMYFATWKLHIFACI